MLGRHERDSKRQQWLLRHLKQARVPMLRTLDELEFTALSDDIFSLQFFEGVKWCHGKIGMRVATGDFLIASGFRITASA